MLPPALTSVYRRYKQDTDLVASWLATTAQEHGFSASSLAEPTEKNAGPRLKGKARRIARAQQENDGRPRAVIAIKSFVPLASFIAAHKKSRIKVPAAFVRSLNRVIEARKSMPARLAYHGQAPDQASDQRHSHFVAVLVEVRDLLGPLIAARAALDLTSVSASLPSPLGDASQHLGHGFRVLEAYYPSDEFVNAPESLGPASPSARYDSLYEAERENTWESSYFAFVALLDDFSLLRQQVKTLWEAYLSGKLSLSSVAVATNTALEMARGMEMDVADVLSGPRNEHTIGELLMSHFFDKAPAVCGGGAWDPKTLGDHSNLDLYEPASDGLIVALVSLETFWEGADSKAGRFAFPSESDTCLDGSWIALYHSILDASSTASNNMFGADATSLSSVLHYMAKWNHGIDALQDDSLVPRDEFQRGLRTYLCSDEGVLTLSLCLASQIHLDVLKILGPHTKRPYAETRCLSLARKDNVLAVANCYGDDCQGRDLRSSFEWALACNETWISGCPDGCLDKFLQQHLILCGLFQHDERMKYHKAALHYAATEHCIQYAYHLYHALRQEKLLLPDQRWEDLDVVLDKHGEVALFVGSAPKDFGGYIKCFSLSTGDSLATWTKSARRQGRHVHLKHGRKPFSNFKPIGPLSEHTCRAESFKFSPSRSMQTREVKMIMEARKRLFPEKTDAPGGAGAAENKSQGARQKGEPKSTAISPVELVETLAWALEEEVTDLSFDYLTLHRQCQETLRKVMCKLPMYENDDDEAVTWDCYMNRDLQNMVGCLFLESARALRDPLGVESLSPNKLQDAASVFLETIKGENSRLAISNREKLKGAVASFAQDGADLDTSADENAAVEE